MFVSVASFGLALLVTTQVSSPSQIPDTEVARPVASRPVVQAPETPESSIAPSTDRDSVVFHLNHVPANDAAEALGKWLGAEEDVTGQPAANVVPIVITNDVVASGSEKQRASIQKILVEIDRPKKQIQVKAMLIEFTPSEEANATAVLPGQPTSHGDFDDILSNLNERGETSVLAEPTLLCFDNQPAYVQSGSRVPRVTGTARTARGSTNSVTLENVGTILGVTCRVSDPDLVTLEIDLEQSQLGRESEGTPLSTANDGSVIRSPQLKTLTVQTTVSLRSGQTAVLGGMTHQAEPHARHLLFLVQPVLVQSKASSEPALSSTGSNNEIDRR